jgi:hypothetical protein
LDWVKQRAFHHGDSIGGLFGGCGLVDISEGGTPGRSIGRVEPIPI